MKKSLLATAAATALAVLAAAVPADAQRGYYYGPGIYYPPQSYTYNGAPGYVADPTGPCYWQRQRFWDGFGWRVRTVRVCG